MTIRAFFNSLKEGIVGIIRHPLVTIASVTTILLMLLIMCSFFIFSADARFIMKKLGQQPPIEIYMELDARPENINFLSEQLSKDSRVIEVILRSPEENYQYFKENLGDSGSILDNFDYNTYLPYTFNIQLLDPSFADDICYALETYPDVQKVAKESNVMAFLVRARHIVNVVSVIAFIVLFVIALFIISNMVRISVYSRAEEIEIMKFVGATNFYIRMPYVVEGGIVGLISALCAWGVTCLAYNQLYIKVMSSVDLNSFYSILPLNKVMWVVLLIACLMGVLIGAMGSGISVRKYIRV
ncbi:MAG: ABC transporter permease [Clostridia bacterium]|nr:ABC transporter permease [Clostridia bacterium]